MDKPMILNLLIPIILGFMTNCNKPDYEFLVDKPFMGGQYYVATWGDDDNAGTFDKPFATLQKAMNVSQPGDTTYIRGGVYHITSPQSIDPSRRQSTAVSGTRENPIHYYNYPGEEPIFDGAEMVVLFPAGIVLWYVQYIKLRGITVRNIFQNTVHRDPAEVATGISGIRVANITFERVTVHDVHGRGWWQESGGWADHVFPGIEAYFPYDTSRWINCDAYNLHDPLSATPGNAADGWKVHNHQAGVFIWEGCRAWNYSDDGFDPSGHGNRYFYNTWAMSSNKYAYLSDSEGNGFKTSRYHPDAWYEPYPEDTILVKYINCIAVFNPRKGFHNNITGGYQNNAYFFNNLAYGNGIGIADFSASSQWGEKLPLWNQSTFRNNISYGSEDAGYGDIQIYRVLYDHEYTNTWVPTGGWPGSEPNDNFTLEDAAFTSLDSMTIVNELTAPRKADGSLPDITWARLATDSDLKGAGSYVGMSADPDIGVDWGYLDRMQRKVFFDFLLR